MRSWIGTVGAAMCLALVVGAVDSPRGRPGEIPLGEWSGRGTCIYEWWDATAESPVEEAVEAVMEDAGAAPLEDIPVELEEPTGATPKGRTIHRRYPTMLRIWEESLDGHDAVMLEIRSRRGRLPQLGDETHLLVALEKARRISRATTLYRVIALAFSPQPDSLPAVNEAAPPCSASCTTIGDTTVLQIRYLEDFVDILRFEGDRVEKTGIYQARGGMIHWTEQLEER